MTHADGINLKNAGPKIKRKLNRKVTNSFLFVGLMVATAFYCRYLHYLTHVHVSARASHKASAAIAPATHDPKVKVNSSKPDDPPEVKNNDDQVPTEAAAGFFETLMAVITPSARASTMQPEMHIAPKPAKRAVAPTMVRATPSREMQPLTAGQKRLKTAQDAFDDVMNLACTYPTSYGFTPDECLADARLGNPIPIYTIAPQSQMHYTGQPLKTLLKPAEEWVYPVILNRSIRFMVTVRFDGWRYVPGEVSRALAMHYEKILARWPAGEGYHPQLVVIPKMPGYYFTIPELPRENITDTSRMLDFNPSLAPATVLLAGWQ